MWEHHVPITSGKVTTMTTRYPLVLAQGDRAVVSSTSPPVSQNTSA